MRAPPLGGQRLFVFVSFRAFLMTPSVAGTRDRGASQYLKTADSIAAKHLIGPAQSDLGRFFVVCGSKRRWHRGWIPCSRARRAWRGRVSMELEMWLR